MRVVIIEDERITANDLKRTLLVIDPDIQIVAMLASVEEGLAYFKTAPQVDLIFSDIQLGDGLSFDIFKKVEANAPVIFCTAYNTYSFEAFGAAGIDYVLKPFSKASIQKALDKYQSLGKKFSRNQDYSSILSLLEAKLQPKKSAVITRHRDKITPLDVAAIALFYIEHSGTFAYTFSHEKFLLTETLDELETSFSPQFFRANRQFLVNRKAVKDASQHFNRKMAVNLTLIFKETILVGKLKTAAFVEWLSHA